MQSYKTKLLKGNLKCFDHSSNYQAKFKNSSQLQRSKLPNGTADVEAGSGAAIPQAKWYSFISPIFFQAFTLTFLAEWGDRSQLTTIILAAREVRSILTFMALTCCMFVDV